MYKKPTQLNLLDYQSINITSEVKRQMRLALRASALSRDEVCDRMNEIAATDGIKGTYTKTTLDSWLREDAGRMPGPQALALLCRVLGTLAPIAAMVKPLGGAVIGQEEARVLAWGQAEIDKRQAAKRARRALQEIEG